MATGIREGKLWIQTRPGEGWAPPGYSCSRHATWVASTPMTKPGHRISLSIVTLCFMSE